MAFPIEYRYRMLAEQMVMMDPIGFQSMTEAGFSRYECFAKNHRCAIANHSHGR